MSEYYTHQKYLKEELNKLPQNAHVLELGVGGGSSSLMSDFCLKNLSCKVQGFETSNQWLKETEKKYGLSSNYTFTYLSSWDLLESHLDIKNNIYDLVFVDQSPWKARIDSIKLLSSCTKVFILHDYDTFNTEKWHKSEGLTVQSKNIRVNDDSTYLGLTFGEKFILEDNFEILPPTLVMRNKALS
jgi:hypothetical protein